MATAAERQRRTRRRRRRGVIPIQVEVSAQEIEALRQRGYDARPGDKVSISNALSEFLGDWALEAMG